MRKTREKPRTAQPKPDTVESTGETTRQTARRPPSRAGHPVPETQRAGALVRAAPDALASRGPIVAIGEAFFSPVTVMLRVASPAVPRRR